MKMSDEKERSTREMTLWLARLGLLNGDNLAEYPDGSYRDCYGKVLVEARVREVEDA